jgi:hypothetical protein
MGIGRLMSELDVTAVAMRRTRLSECGTGLCLQCLCIR